MKIFTTLRDCLTVPRFEPLVTVEDCTFKNVLYETQVYEPQPEESSISDPQPAPIMQIIGGGCEELHPPEDRSN